MIAIIKYNAGNVASVKNAVKRLGYEVVITDNAEDIKRADKVIFPGVGAAASAMQYLREKGLDEVIVNLKQPVLGICLGLQLLCKSSEEGGVDCLGIFENVVKRFPPEDKVPHMGWNDFRQCTGDLFRGINQTENVYYVHSYYATLGAATIASTEYIESFSAVLQRNNFYATQFHPEKSGEVGALLLKNFLEI